MRRTEPKKELSPKGLEYFKTRVWQMPYLDRISILSLSIINREPEALAAALGLTALISKMTQGCGRTNRMRVAEALRSAADVLDHEVQNEKVV
jgi:hypothetical protein